LARDITDTKFLDLALAADADYLVTNDHRHLLPLKIIGRTRIVTPHKFMLALRHARR
jgi:predicted nucleic acid-binding protein